MGENYGIKKVLQNYFCSDRQCRHRRGVADTADAAKKRVKWKMQSAFGGKIKHLGPNGTSFTDKVKSMSDEVPNKIP